MKHCCSPLLALFRCAVTPMLLIVTWAAMADELKMEHQSANSSLWQPVSDATLSALRGGFMLSNGLVVDIQFEKSIYQNGELTSHSYFQTPENINLASKEEFNLSSVLPDSTFNTVVQNALDNQTLATVTNIDITIKNLELAQLAFARNELYTSFFDGRSH